MSHTGWMRWRTTEGSDPEAAAALRPQGRKLLGALMDDLQHSGRRTGSIRQPLPDGSVLMASFDGTTPLVTIDTTATMPEGPDTDPSNLWVPRGFVVYPAWRTAPFGVGLPIVPTPDTDAFAGTNLAPGLDPARWTAGGTCGEVLLSPDKDAGYPRPLDIAVPLLFHPLKGPVWHWAGDVPYDARPTGPWRGYRLELAPFRAHYADENPAVQRAMLEDVQARRATAGAVPGTLRLRGFASVAETAASVLQAAGSTDEYLATYPATYRHAADRLSKEGYPADWRGVVGATFVRNQMFRATEFRGNGGAASVVQGWSEMPGSLLAADFGQAVELDVGWRGGYATLAIKARDRWIAAGNANWQSADHALPPVSWHSFASVNLAWETFPAQFDPTPGTPTPLVPRFGFTTAAGDCWLRYPRAYPVTAAQSEPALGRHIYCRGRAIALAPRGGLVWGAGVVAGATADRLIALVHHPEDQPADTQTNGCTRYLRVWWADVPRRRNLRLAPQMVIVGEDPADPLSWHGGELLDLGSAPAPAAGFVASGPINSLKYASCWRFAADGLRAICLRDYGTLADYGVLRASARNGWSAALNARTLELHFTVLADAVTTQVDWHGYTAGGTVDDRLLVDSRAPDLAPAWSVALYEQPAQPIAVDYDRTGAVVYAYSARVVSHQYVPYNPPDGSTGFVSTVGFAYVGTGSAAVRYATDLTDRVLHGSRFQSPGVDAYDELAAVLDVRAAAFALKVTRPRYAIDPANALGSVTKVDRPCPNFTSIGVNGVTLTRRGGVLGADWYPAPDGVVWTLNDPCYPTLADVNTTWVFLPPAVSGHVQGFHVARFGRELTGYLVAPVPGAAMVLAGPPGTSPCGCFPTPAELFGGQWLADAQQAPRGGRVASAVPVPACDWLIYAKVV